MSERARMIDLTTAVERAFLIGLDDPNDDRWPVQRSLAELTALAETAGATVVGTAFQRRPEPDPVWYFGKGRAAELLYSGRSLGGDEALAWGFLNRLVAPEQLLDETLAWAGEIAAGPGFGHAMTKRMLHQEWAMGVDEAIESEAQAQAICMMTKDFHRAYEAFVAKQKPAFRGD